MKTKPLEYYKPEIEEFGIGFKFEMYGAMGFVEHVYPEPWGDASTHDWTGRMKNYLSSGVKMIRVKRLDQQDIEELGWVKTEGTNEYTLREFMVIVKKFCLVFKEKTGKNYTTIIRRINVRNKNEMAQLMRQIGINLV